MKSRSEDTAQKASRRGIARAPRSLRVALQIAAVMTLGAVASVPVAQGVCCVCEGSSNECFSSVPANCDQCRNICGQMMRACCEGVVDCSAGGADSCGVMSGFCVEVSTAPGFCDGTCAGQAPTATPTVTPTQTPTSTATATHTPTPQPNGSSCTNPGQCASTFCVDGVCCDTACTAPGEQCNLAGQRGTCASVTAPAPTLTPRGLAFAAALLAVVAAFALRRRAFGR